MMDAMLGMCFRWFSGGKGNKHELRKFADWMPADWQGEKRQAKSTDIVDQLNAFRRRYDGNNY